MNIIHPVSAVVATEVVDLGVHEAAGGGDASAWISTSDLRLDPRESASVEEENIV